MENRRKQSKLSGATVQLAAAQLIFGNLNKRHNRHGLPDSRDDADFRILRFQKIDPRNPSHPCDLWRFLSALTIQQPMPWSSLLGSLLRSAHLRKCPEPIP